jgi:hypothetical protein
LRRCWRHKGAQQEKPLRGRVAFPSVRLVRTTPPIGVSLALACEDGTMEQDGHVGRRLFIFSLKEMEYEKSQ